MVGGVFRRSLSFPNKHPNRPAKPPISHHIRSISLPCRSHPLISQIREDISELKTWSSKLDDRTSAWLCDGLRRLKDIHDFLDDILRLPQTLESLRNQNDWVEKLLEDFLRFVDVYGIFQTHVMALKEEQFAAQVAIRKKDDAKIAMYLKAKKRLGKEMSKLAGAIRCIGQYPVPPSMAGSILDAELAGVIYDAVEVTVLVTVALFNGISTAFASRTRSRSPASSSWMRLRLLLRSSKIAAGYVNNKKVTVDESIQEFKQICVVENLQGFRKKVDNEQVRVVFKNMQDLEGLLSGIESISDKVYRSLITTRVSLLNTLTLSR